MFRILQKYVRQKTKSKCTAATLTKCRLFSPRRALLYVPASDVRKLEKLPTLCVDTVVIDLEDGVSVNRKVSECCCTVNGNYSHNFHVTGYNCNWCIRWLRR